MSFPLAQPPGQPPRGPVLRLLSGGEPRSVDALIDEAQLAERQGQREEARSLYEQALHQLTDASQAPIASNLMRWIGRTYQVDANYDAALDCIVAALAVAEAAGDEAAAGHAINLHAIVCWQQGDLDQAELLYEAARERAQRAGEAKLTAMTALNLGTIANIRGNLHQALHHYETSLADYRSLGLARDVCIALNNLGMLYKDMQRWDAAERAYSEAVQISTALGDLTTEIKLEVNFAELWVSQNEFEKARKSCDRAMELSQRIQDTHAYGETYKIYGVIARETGDYPAADDDFNRADEIATERQDLLLLAQTAREKADLYRRQGRNRDTLQALNRAYRLFSQLRARRELADVARRNSRLESDFLEVVRKWGDSIESKDRYTQGHCERVADIACALARKAGIDEKSLFWFRIGALLHDVGKIITPPEVLNKPGKLTEEEWALIKQHPTAGVEMLADIEFPWDVRPIVESHHERWDGGGYPHGLKGTDIPLTARILCVADVYDALTSERSYKKALAHDDAMNIMRRDVGRQFDPELWAHFEDVMREMSTLAPPLPPFEAPPRPEVPLPQATKIVVNEVDELTGVPLRRAFLETTTKALADRRGTDQPVSLLVIDVDHFKLVNDTYGHLQGDDVLRSVASLLRAGIRNGDFVGRYAGDEFVVLCPNARTEEAMEVAERLRSTVSGHKFVSRAEEGGLIAVTLSIGVATAPAHGESVETLFAAADRALYESKRQGRNAATAAEANTEQRKPELNIERFIGRVEESRKLVRLLESSTRGDPRVAAICGEAGVGKSTLLRRLAPEVRLRAGALVLGRCLEADVKPPYGPWADVINAIRSLGIVPDRPWRELPRLVPALEESTLIAGATQQPSTGNKYALYDEIVEYLRLAAATRPLSIVLDDMQWADSATWDTLEHLFPQLTDDRILICLTIRVEDAGGVTERRRRLSRDERFHEIALQRLTRDELKQWIDAVFRQSESSRELLQFLYQYTEGNPLLIVQVLRTLIEEGGVAYDGSQWEWRPPTELRLPVAVNDLIARRLERLSAKARSVLATAAVIGRTFDVDLAVAAGAGTEDELLDAIDEGIASSVLEPAGARNGDSFAFTHALLAEAMRKSTNGRRLKRMHERVASAMERFAPTQIAEIAAHYDAAACGEKAFEYAMLAGQRATSVYALDEATSFFAMALRHAPTPARLAEARLKLAHVAETAGRYKEAEELCDQVLAWFSTNPDETAAMPVRRMRERLRFLQGQPPIDTLTACRELLAAAEAAGNDSERVALLTMISHTHTRLGDWPAAEQLARECVRMAQEMGDKQLLADALTRLGTTLLETHADEAIQCYGSALRLFKDLEDLYGQVRCHINTGIAYSRIGNAPEAERAYEVGLTLGRTAHTPDLAGLASLNLGVLYMKGGKYEQAHARYIEAQRLFTTVRSEPHRLATLYNLGHLARERDDAMAALDLYEETAILAGNIGQADVEIGALAGVGLACLVLGQRAAAERWSRVAEALIGARTDWWFQGRELVEALDIRVAIAEGKPALAERRFFDSLALAERHDGYGAAWLVAECATPLADAGRPKIWDTVKQYAEVVDALGYAPLSARYAAFSQQWRNRMETPPIGTAIG